jgi:indole-3-glycerol phosphate synthase
MSLLDRIVEEKKKRLGSVKGKVSLRDLQSRITDSEKPRPFKEAVRRDTGQIRLIAEIKKASPSRGTIRENFDLLGIARIYEDKAVDAISVVTEEDFFSGVLDALPTVKEAVTRPVLRKDFLFDEYQMYESRAFGADAVLFIASLLGRAQAEEYLHLCKELGLSVLFEVHGPDDLEKALRVGADIIGINNRDLKTLTLDLDTTFMLKKEIPSDKIIVSESGVKTREDVSRLDQAGIDAMLVGTTLMESRDIGKKIDELWAHGLARI